MARLPWSIACTAALAACGPTFDPASLIDTTRVLGARVEVAGAPDRASPRAGETVDVTWLVTSPAATPPLRWAFAVCTPAGGLGCASEPLAVFEGTDVPPRLSFAVPPATSATSLIVYGALCAGGDAMSAFDPQSATCTGDGTTALLTIPLQLGDDANHNPTADRGFTFDGQPWPATGDPCATGPRVTAGTQDHVLGNLTDASDRERYPTASATPARESLQISQLTTAGTLQAQFSFVEATDERATTTVERTWDAPEADEVAAGGLAVTFTFVVRDGRGGTDWTTRAACVER